MSYETLSIHWSSFFRMYFFRILCSFLLLLSSSFTSLHSIVFVFFCLLSACCQMSVTILKKNWNPLAVRLQHTKIITIPIEQMNKYTNTQLIINQIMDVGWTVECMHTISFFGSARFVLSFLVLFRFYSFTVSLNYFSSAPFQSVLRSCQKWKEKKKRAKMK